MPALAVSPPFAIFPDINGNPLDNGAIYIGVAGLPAATNPISVFFDEALSVPAAQPVTVKGGYPMNGSTRARLFVNSDYSIEVRNVNGTTVFSALESTDILSSDLITFIASGSGAVQRTVQSKLRDVVSVKDFGAVGDGVTNDAAALSAMATFPGFFPAGTYNVGSDVAGLGKQFYGMGKVLFTGAGKVQTPTAFGIGALANNTGFNTGAPTLTDKNTAFGTRALYNNTTGYHNTAVGDETLFTNVTGNQNTAVGMNALYYATGDNNTAVGVAAFRDLTTGSDNTAVGRSAAFAWLTGSMNAFVGRNAMVAKTSGSNNAVVGAMAGFLSTGSLDNCSILGASAAYSAPASVTHSVAIGYQAGFTAFGNYNVLVGSQVATNSSAAADNVVAIGYQAASNNRAAETLAIGTDALLSQTTATQNVAIGHRAGRLLTTTGDNTLLGWRAGSALGGGGVTAQRNTLLGSNSCGSLFTGSTNTIIGWFNIPNANSSSGNILVGANIMQSATDATDCTFIGNVVNRTGSRSNELVIATGSTARIEFNTTGGMFLHGSSVAVQPNADNTTNLGSASYRWTNIYATNNVINTSDARLKCDVEELSETELRVAHKVKKLVRKFRYIDAANEKGTAARLHIGVIAQEVVKAFESEGLDPMRYGIVCYDEWEARAAELDEEGNTITPARDAGSYYGIRYEQLLAFIIAAL